MSGRRIDVIGGGPGGLYAARLLKVARPDWTVTVHERMAGSNDTFGFGVGLTVSTMENLAAADPESAEDIHGVSHSGHGLLMLGDGGPVDLHGARNLSIGRHSLLEVLAGHARAVGVDIRSGSHVEAASIDSDVVIAADGVGSATRGKLTEQLGAEVTTGRGIYMWCGVDFALDDAIFAPARTDDGLFVAHAYPYSPDRSTFLVEADEASWRGAGLDASDAATVDGDSDEHSLRYLERAFTTELRGRPLLGNRSRWSRFRTVHLDRWSVGNVVLIGDAAHTAHYTLGSGTKLALEDAIALSRELLAEPEDTTAAFAAYEESRRASIDRFQHLAERSQRWWESYHLRADQPISQLATGFMTRAGNIDLDRFAEAHADVVADGLAVYSGGPAPSPLPDDLSGWVLAQPFRSDDLELDGRIVADPHELGAVDVTAGALDPWGEPAAELVAQARRATAPVRLRGVPGRGAVHTRLDLAERIKLETDATVIVDVSTALAPDAAAALVAGRCDLVHLTD